MQAAILLLQLAVIIVVARLFGFLFQRLRQPAVIGEMVAGIVLGPSLFGYLLPDQHAALFPDQSRVALTVIAQTGVILFMFVVGTRLELDVFREAFPRDRCHRDIRDRRAVRTGRGARRAFFTTRSRRASIPRLPFILFLATAMSVTAFPVLARIIVERRLDGTVPGNTALVCAAINDFAAWVLVGSVAAFVAGDRTPVSLAVHGLFVAFVTGVACAILLPRVVPLAAMIEAPASKVLLPVFFALTGLRTDLRLLADGNASWMWCAAIVVTATAGKLGGTALAARWAGMPRAEALTLGALMNTRGLMELVVLNIGYELGLLPPSVFAMMVVMALVTTCAAGPLVDRWSVSYRKSSALFAP